MRADLAGEGYPLRLANPHQEWVYWWYCASSDVFTDGYSNSYGACRPVMPHRYVSCCWRLRIMDEEPNAEPDEDRDLFTVVAAGTAFLQPDGDVIVDLETGEEWPT